MSEAKFKPIEEITETELQELWPLIGGAPHLFEYGKDELRQGLSTGSFESLQMDYYTMAAIVDYLRGRGYEAWSKDLHPSESAGVKDAVWVKGQYDRLYNQVKAGKRTVCYVDYRWDRDDKTKPMRDICAIKAETMEFSARGICYGTIRFMEGDAKKNFIQLCESMNVEWLDESVTPAQSEKEDAVLFAEWLDEHYVTVNEGEEELLWRSNASLEKLYTTGQLYDIFKNPNK